MRGGNDFAILKSRVENVTGLDVFRLDDDAVGAGGDGVAALESGVGAKDAEEPDEPVETGGTIPELKLEGGKKQIVAGEKALFFESEQMIWAMALERGEAIFATGLECVEPGLQMAEEREGEFVEGLLAGIEPAAGVAQESGGEAALKFFLFVQDGGAEMLLLAAGEMLKTTEEIGAIGGGEFGGCTGGGRAQVGDKIRDGKIGLVSHGRNHRENAAGDGAGDDFFVERPEIFNAASSATNDEKIDGRVFLKLIDGGSDFLGGAFALDFDGQQIKPHPGGATGEDGEHILQSSAGGGGHEADGLGKAWEGPFACGIEETFGVENAFESLEACLQRPLPLGLDALHDELILAAGFVNGDFAFNQHSHAVFDFLAGGGAGKPDAGELGAFVFESKIMMARGLATMIGDFATDGDFADAFFQETANPAGEFTDGKDLRFGGKKFVHAKVQAEIRFRSGCKAPRLGMESATLRREASAAGMWRRKSGLFWVCPRKP